MSNVLLMTFERKTCHLNVRGGKLDANRKNGFGKRAEIFNLYFYIVIHSISI